MPLTPMRTRGKRKAPATNEPLAIRKPLPSPQEKQRRPLAAVLAARASRQRATLATLPDEILEQILLCSLSLALPRASHRLGCKLSARATLIRLFVQAFEPTWDQWFGIVLDEPRSNHPAMEDGRFVPCFEGDPELQSAILKLPWATIDLILQAQQTWADTHARGRWFSHGMKSLTIAKDGTTAFGYQFEGGLHHLDGAFGHFDARTCFDFDYQQLSTWSPSKFGLVLPVTYDRHPNTVIPHELLAGPWDDEKQRRLFWLARGGSITNSVLRVDVSWETKMECLRNGLLDVSEPNVVVLNCLAHTDMLAGIPSDLVKQVIADLDTRLRWGADSLPGREVIRYVRDKLEVEDDMMAAGSAFRRRPR